MGRGRRAREEPAGADADRGPEADPESVARTILLTKLTARARSRGELAGALAERGVPGDVAERMLDRFEDVGLVDDAAFARAWVESRHGSRGLSRRALAEELRRKGVGDEVVAESLAGVDSDSERDAARRLVDKKLRTSRVVDPRARWRQLAGLLARRGYPSDLAARVIADALADQASTAEEGLSGGSSGVPSSLVK